MIPPALHARHLAQAEAAEARPISRTGAILIAVIWCLAALWLASLFWATRYY
jgi:hypothetical protein